MFIMKLIPKLPGMIFAAIKKEMTIQKPVYVAAPIACCNCNCKKSKSKGGDAVKGLLLLIIAPLIGLILFGLVL